VVVSKEEKEEGVERMEWSDINYICGVIPVSKRG
jgi:hypothetical protein